LKYNRHSIDENLNTNYLKPPKLFTSWIPKKCLYSINRLGGPMYIPCNFTVKDIDHMTINQRHLIFKAAFIRKISWRQNTKITSKKSLFQTFTSTDGEKNFF